MDPAKLGVVDPTAQPKDTPAPPASPEAPKGDTPKDPPTAKPQGQPGDKGGDAPEDKDKRINDLMSKWRTEEHGHHLSKTELQKYKERYGELKDGDVPSKPAEPKGDTPRFMSKEWQPQTMDELKEALTEASQFGAKQALQGFEQQQRAAVEAKQQVDDFVEEVKKHDEEFDEKDFFAYIERTGFPIRDVNDLRASYRSHFELRTAAKKAAKEAVENKDKRNAPVNQPGAGGGTSGSGTKYSEIQRAGSAAELVSDYLRK